MTQLNFLDLVKRLEAHQVAGEWPQMLLEISNLVIAMINDPRARGLVFGSLEMDRFCLAAGEISARQLGQSPSTAYNDHLAVHVTTEVYDGQGGHTLALKDVIRARPDLTHVVLVTNLHDRTLPLDRFNRDMAQPVQVLAAPALSLPDKLRWLQLQLAALKPGLLTLFHHHYDVAAVAAAQPGVAREMAYFHHADHDMALGVYLPHALHVDCTQLSHHKCRHHLGVSNQVYWPLVSPDQGGRQGHEFMRDGQLLTCAHGSSNKFLAPGRYAYFDVLLRRLTEVGGAHVHIGQLPPEELQNFRERLDAAGVEASRFQHQPPVPSLWHWLRDSPIDLCISSFPVQGAKGLVETQGAGLPVLIQQSSLSTLHSTRDLVYQEALWWETPDDFIRALKAVTPELLAEQAYLSRRYYERWHHPRELSYALNNPRRTAPCPPVRDTPCDTLALYLR
ncbi:hypothetical protein ACS5PN_02070 [Roseateles sp. NT4]|uniref:hypothetical protein n=1 Tax=Roseateles sp. NT4 TaxID=3453715 RepID=UPI003EEF2D2E